MTDMPVWERRFRAPKMTLPHWPRGAARRTVFASNESGVWQVHTWDVTTGDRRKISNHPVGVREGVASPDGAEVLFWQEDTGDETGRWLVQAFEGGSSEPYFEGIPVGWNEGLALGPGVAAVAIADRDGGFAVFVSLDGAPAKEIVRSTEAVGIAGAWDDRSDLAGFSADGTRLSLAHAEHGDVLHPSLRVVDPRTGGTVGERGDGSSSVHATAWSPIPGDQRLAITLDDGDRQRVAIWDLATDRSADLDIPLPGDLTAVDWWPDAGAVLVVHAFEGRGELYRFELADGSFAKLETPPGSISDARVRPDGSVWFLHTDGMHPPRILDDRGGEPVSVPEERGPAGRPFVEWRYRNEAGQEVHGWIVEPEGEGPHPVMVFVHGGPHWLYEDKYFPEVQSYVDAGFVVGMPNYRGSSGYGRGWSDALTGDVGFTDVDDVTAGLRDLLRRDDVDPSRAVVAGWSWGGYITLMQLGRNPDLWAAGMAGVPVGDYVRAYTEEAPTLQALDRALMGGTPESIPDAYRRSSPISYVEDVAAPVLLVIGENDSRCPVGQALAYSDRLKELGKPHDVYLYTTGHGSLDTDEDVRQQRVVLDFLRSVVPGIRQI